MVGFEIDDQALRMRRMAEREKVIYYQLFTVSLESNKGK